MWACWGRRGHPGHHRLPRPSALLCCCRRHNQSHRPHLQLAGVLLLVQLLLHQQLLLHLWEPHAGCVYELAGRTVLPRNADVSFDMI